jgi:hypothetical protein
MFRAEKLIPSPPMTSGAFMDKLISRFSLGLSGLGFICSVRAKLYIEFIGTLESEQEANTSFFLEKEGNTS